MSVPFETRAAGVCRDVDIPGVVEWRIGGWRNIVGIDHGHGKVGTTTMIPRTMPPVDETV